MTGPTPYDRGSFLMAGKGIAMCLLLLTAVAPSAPAQLSRLLAPVPAEALAAVNTETASAALPAAPSTPKAKDSHLFTAEDLLRELQTQLIDHYSLTGDLVLELARPWGAVQIPATGATVTILDYPNGAFTNTLAIRCRLNSGDQTLGEWLIPLRAKLYQEVWVASSRLDRGQALDTTMVNAQKIDILLNRNALLGSDINLSQYELTQSVNTGQPLTKRDVAEKPVIHKNQIVDVIARRGALAITMKAQALENGAAKALIRMRNLDSRREFNAQVIDETRVNVLF